MESGNKILGNNIKAYRNAKGWSQEELAHLSGITPAHLGHIERGEGTPTLLTLLSVSNALQVDLSELVKSNVDATVSASTLSLINYRVNFQSFPKTDKERFMVFLKPCSPGIVKKNDNKAVTK